MEAGGKKRQRVTKGSDKEDEGTDEVEEVPRKKTRSGPTGSTKGAPVSKQKARKEGRTILEIADEVAEQMEEMEDARRAAIAARNKMDRMFEVWRTIGEEMVENIEEWKKMSKKLEKGKAKA